MMWENKINEDEVMRGEVKAGDLMKVKKFYLQRSECFDAAPTKLFLVMDVTWFSFDNFDAASLWLREVKSGKEFKGMLYEQSLGHKKEEEIDDEHLQIKMCPTAPEEKPNKTTYWKRVML